MLNMDFSVPVFVDIDDLEWLPSPMPGVKRKPLAREDAERGHATSIVRYAPGSVFRAHPHPLGEEILVLEGEFCDETGRYPAGTYFRNPPGSSHAPFSPDGCVLFVKLHQFEPLDSEQVVIGHDVLASLSSQQLYRLHQYQNESVYLLKLPKGKSVGTFLKDVSGSVEVLVVTGQLAFGQRLLPALSWLRSPFMELERLSAFDDSVLWIKNGHF